MGRDEHSAGREDDQFHRVFHEPLNIDLQLFADPDRTEKPTPRRRRKAREEGQVAVSRELNMAVGFLAATIALKLLLPQLSRTLMNASVPFFSLEPVDEETLSSFVFHLFRDPLVLLILLMSIVALVSIIVGALQTKFLFSFKPLKFDLNRINPIDGLKRMFSLRNLFELFKTIVKLAIVGYVSYSLIKQRYSELPRLSDVEPHASVWYLADLVSTLMLRCAIAMLVLALVDYLFQRWEFEKSLRMTRQELKEEFKEVEGNPEVKRRQREIMMRLARSRMLQKVPEADVVITNPTHVAVALQYDSENMEAPEVIAKGADEVAKKIVEIATKSGVPIVRNPQVAWELFKSCEVGEQIPPNLYRAVAEILAYVYSLR
ncbi:flagellar biosynthetic protein FlhB [Thermotoga sp. Ku-13t]|uniref:flagellar biosynthesis protein FlhB n=1 Tax=Thermotoga sp. Ku-13t TaxID=1755813 RepID=UPI0013E9ED3F|nr:flagellar biosynthesis protein FlhB [Thermotoga sp. Ku-13t]KAF2957617.1 flagellar biosynthetic protein FlhB [Thermotoga sp. Ku-13t]